MSFTLTTFDPKAYIERWYKEPTWSSNLYEWMKEAFDFVPECQWGIEIGCGPVIILSAFASRKVQNIIMSEFNTECFSFIQEWIKGENSHLNYDWSHHLTAIATVEGQQKGEDIASRLRDRVKMCMKVDLRSSNIFEFPVFVKPDIIFSSLCVQAAARNAIEYKEMVGKLKSYLKIGGYLFLVGVLEQTFYMVQEQKLLTFPLTKQVVEATMETLGFQTIFFHAKEELITDPTQHGYDGKGLFTILAQLKQ